MTSTRLNHCLGALRRRDTDLPDASAYCIGEVRTWLDGREHPLRLDGMARGTGEGLQRLAPASQRA